jgi:CDP-paratose 2-epimerase
MKVLITGICGFVGSSVALSLLERRPGIEIHGIDNLMRPGSETNRSRLVSAGVRFVHGDIRCASDFESLAAVDWVIDAAANPSVLAGLGKGAGSRQLFEHNLSSVINVLEYCKSHGAGFLLLSSSRVYSIPALVDLPLRAEQNSFQLDDTKPLPIGVSAEGIGVPFSTQAPISLYGSTKLAAEAISLEYGEAFQFPVWINRCGVLTGAGQFGTPDQGIFAYWINAHLRRRALRYIGFDGTGKQVRDALHPRDLTALLDSQMSCSRSGAQRIYTAGGGTANAVSLSQLNTWCNSRFGTHTPNQDLTPRPYDIPWIIMDNREVTRDFGWQVELSTEQMFEEIALHAEAHPEWLSTSGIR